MESERSIIVLGQTSDARKRDTVVTMDGLNEAIKSRGDKLVNIDLSYPAEASDELDPDTIVFLQCSDGHNYRLKAKNAVKRGCYVCNTIANLMRHDKGTIIYGVDESNELLYRCSRGHVSTTTEQLSDMQGCQICYTIDQLKNNNIHIELVEGSHLKTARTLLRWRCRNIIHPIDCNNRRCAALKALDGISASCTNIRCCDTVFFASKMKLMQNALILGCPKHTNMAESSAIIITTFLEMYFGRRFDDRIGGLVTVAYNRELRLAAIHRLFATDEEVIQLESYCSNNNIRLMIFAKCASGPAELIKSTLYKLNTYKMLQPQHKDMDFKELVDTIRDVWNSRYRSLVTLKP